jgi:hypothetical protein
MTRADIDELTENEFGFIIFILGEADSYLVIPAKRLLEELKNYVQGRRKVKRGFYHFNLPLPSKAFAQLPTFELSAYVNNLQLIQTAIEL